MSGDAKKDADAGPVRLSDMDRRLLLVLERSFNRSKRYGPDRLKSANCFGSVM